MIQNDVGLLEHEEYISSHSKLHEIHVILKTITRTRTLKGGGFGLTERDELPPRKDGSPSFTGCGRRSGPSAPISHT